MMVGKVPHILLLAEGANWIFERHCYTIKAMLSSHFKFTIAYGCFPFDEDDYDLIYPLEWNLVPPERIKNPVKYVTGIRGHVFWPELDFTEFTSLLRHNFQRIHVVSSRLYDIFGPQLPFVSQFSHGVDTTFFTPRPRDGTSTYALRVGWAGNANGPADKGFKDFIAPLAELDGVEVVNVGYHGCLLDLEAMRDFYNSLDVYVCASLQEGNNNPLLESAAMGLAIVTTDNGTVPEYLVHGKSALIVERKAADFCRAVDFFRCNPDARVAFGEEARKSVVAKWDWALMAQRYKAFFEEALIFQQKTLEGMVTFCDQRDGAVSWCSAGEAALRNMTYLAGYSRPETN
jgi:hypothetical protein